MNIATIKQACLVLVLLLIGGLALAVTTPAAPASASASTTTGTTEEPSSCEGVDTTKGTGECGDVVESESHSKSGSSSKVVSVNGVSIKSKVTVLARIRANGTPPSQQTNCFNTSHAMSLWTSYNAEGTTGWHWKSYPKGKRFCRINGAVRDPICHNQVKIGVPKSNPPKNAIKGKVKFVKKLRWEAQAVAKADEKVTSFAKAWCTTQSAYAYGEGRGMAYASAVGRGRASGSVKTQVLAAAQSSAAGDLALQLDGQSLVQVKASVRASAFVKATSEASAKAVCKDTPQQPETPKPNLVETDTINDVLWNNTRTITVTGTVAPGHSASLFASAKNGGSIISGKNQTVTGNFTVQVTYKAPSETPGAGNGVSAGRDQVEFTLTQDDGQSDTIMTNQFRILEPEEHPL